MKLQQGDVIDIIAPSSFPKNQAWQQGIQILQSWNLQARFPKEALSSCLFHANSLQKRSLFLNKAFSNKVSSAVWLLRGGYGCQKLMPSFINSYKTQSKKLFIGYSDGTALHLYLNSRNQVSLHAPVISELPLLSKTKLKLLKDILFGIKEEIHFNKLQTFSSSSKTLKAPIIGGNLSLLSSSIGTPWFPPEIKPCFLFLEDINEEAYKIDRMLHHLFYSGILKGVKAILLGDFSPVGRSVFKNKILKSFSNVCKIPIVFGLPCGHKSLHPLAFNTPATLYLEKNKARLTVQLDW